MEECKKIFSNINTKEMVKLELIWFMLFPILNINYVLAAHLAENGRNISIGLDNLIPFVSAFIIPYIYWYIYVVIGVIYILFINREEYMRLMIVMVIGMCICYFVYYIFPTEINRPLVIGDNIFNKLVNIIYSNDKPLNCFPSLHVLNTYIIMRFTRYSYSKKNFYYTQIVGVLIILSTLFIKQHFVADVVASIIIVEILIYLVKKIDEKYIDKLLYIPYKIIIKINNNQENRELTNK